MLAIVAAALVGGPLTTALLWGHGPVFALLCAPLGGSGAGLVAGLTIAALRHAGEARAEQAARASVPSGPVTMLR